MMKPERIILHWTASSHVASPHDKCSYHYLIEHHEGDPRNPDDDVTNTVAGVPVEKNLRDLRGAPSYCRDREDGYAAHTRGFNTGSVGVALCGMRGARDLRPDREVDPGPSPITRLQVRALIGFVVSKLAEYDLQLSEDTVFTHAEAEWIHGRPQLDRWDISWLPGVDLPRRDYGDWIREQVARMQRGEQIEVEA